MSLYLPIKVFKGDRLPQKVCDRCSCKVNDFYQFCNETIEVQNRLRNVLLEQPGSDAKESIDLTAYCDVKPPRPLLPERADLIERATQTECESPPPVPPALAPIPPMVIKIKQEPLPPVKDEDYDDYEPPPIPSDSSDDVSLMNLKKRKKKKGSLINGDVKEHKKRRRKTKPDEEWQSLVSAALNVVAERGAELVMKTEGVDGEGVKQEPGEDVHTCCMCFVRCYSRAEMLHHYKEHARQANNTEAAPPPPPPPAPPDVTPLRCPRCHKLLEEGAAGWAAHWARHWERDTRRPYRCALCDKTFSTHLQILKHGTTHAEAGEGGPEQTLEKRFVCDLCPEAFVYMRCLQSHRDAVHPEARGRAALLRCVQCGRGFAHLNSLRRHWRAHSGARDHLCAVCGKALSSREHLKFHLRIHSGYKPNVCKTCGKGFVKKCNLTLHERVHSGEKPHVCSHCGKAFSQRSTLVIHERYHSGARPYVCALCGRGFVAKGLLSMHLKTTCV